MTNNTYLQILARRLASSRNYLYEATMGDYSMASIARGERQLAAIKAEVETAGLTLDIAPWVETAGCFRQALTLCRPCARKRGLSRSVNTLPSYDFHCDDCDALTNQQFSL